MKPIYTLSEVQRMWAEGYSIEDTYTLLKPDYPEAVDFELEDAICAAYNILDSEMKQLFLRISYGE